MDSSNIHFHDERNHEDSSLSSGQPSIHYLPFQICQNGKATNIGPRFVDTIRNHPDLEEVKETEFRSRPLKGATVELPKNYKGIITSSNSSSSSKLSSPLSLNGNSEKEGQRLIITRDFDRLMNWNWDKIPSSMDTVVKANDWLELASSLHEPES